MIGLRESKSNCKNISLTLEPGIYQDLKKWTKKGQLSALVNQILKKFFAEKKQQELIQAYQSLKTSKVRKLEFQELNGIIKDGIDNW